MIDILKQLINKLLNSLCWSINGLREAYKDLSLKIDLFILVVGIFCAIIFANSNIIRTILIMPLFLLVIVELINTALEKIVDRIGLDIHPLSKAIKDIGSSSVFVTFLLCIFTWVSIFYGS